MILRIADSSLAGGVSPPRANHAQKSSAGVYTPPVHDRRVHLLPHSPTYQREPAYYKTIHCCGMKTQKGSKCLGHRIRAMGRRSRRLGLSSSSSSSNLLRSVRRTRKVMKKEDTMRWILPFENPLKGFMPCGPYIGIQATPTLLVGRKGLSKLSGKFWIAHHEEDLSDPDLNCLFPQACAAYIRFRIGIGIFSLYRTVSSLIFQQLCIRIPPSPKLLPKHLRKFWLLLRAFNTPSISML